MEVFAQRQGCFVTLLLHNLVPPKKTFLNVKLVLFSKYSDTIVLKSMVSPKTLF